MSFQFTEGERHIFRRRPPIKVSQWAAEHLVIPDGPYSGGRYRRDVNPFLAEIMDTWGLPWVEEVIGAAAAQIGKTLCLHACLCFSVDRRPGPRMLAMSNDEGLDRINSGKLRPLLRGCAATRKILGKMTARKVVFKDSTALYLSSAESPAQRASISIRDLFLDEESLYQQKSGQGIPVEEFRERTRSYVMKRKIMRISKPIGGEDCSILQALEDVADEVRRYEVKCPACGEYQEMTEDGLVLVEKCDSPKEVYRRKLARYQCSRCKYLWNDHTRDVAVSRGRWVAKEGLFRPARVGFVIPAILSRVVTLGEVYAAKMKADESDSPAVKQDYDNSYWARGYTAAEIQPEHAQLLELCEKGLPPRTVPKEAVALTCGIDMQKRDFRFTVWAWAPGQRSWLIDFGKIKFWEDVEALVGETMYSQEYDDAARQAVAAVRERAYPREGGGEFPIWRTAIDTGGGTTDPGVLTRTEECYLFLRQHPHLRIYGTKGRSTSSVTAVTWTTIDRLPKSKRPIPGGLQLFLLDVSYLKSLLFGRLRLDANQPARFFDASEEELKPLFDQLTAERLVRRRDGKMVWERLRKDNHYLDCSVLAHACADGSWSPSLQMMIEQEKAGPAKRNNRPKTPAPRAENNRPHWFHSR